MGAAMYAASEAEGAAPPPASRRGHGEGDDDVVDAEIVDEDGPETGTEGENGESK